MNREFYSEQNQPQTIQDLHETLRRERHLKNVLKGVRNVNQLITRETDAEQLIIKACDNLTESLGYKYAWIALMDDSGNVLLTASSKMGDSITALEQFFREGQHPPCMTETLKTKELVVFNHQSDACHGCPGNDGVTGRVGLSITLGHKGKVYGVLAAAAPEDYAMLEEEQSLFKEVAEDLGFALYKMEGEYQKRELERRLKERIKELRCLTSINESMQKDLPDDVFCRQLEKHISEAMQYTAATKVLIRVKDFYSSGKPRDDFSRYPALHADITVNGQRTGYIMVLYTDTDLHFLPEEEKLIQNAARLTGLFFQRRKAIADIRKHRENLRVTLQSIGDGVITTDLKGRVTDMNPIAEKMTAWPLTEATHKPLSEVFHIVNAQTRQKADNPARLVLEQGRIVGMANDTVLIARDGTEYQIADSAAPITDTEGVISGVVMVFSDVTKKYAQKQALQESERRYRALFEHASDGILLITDKGIADCNQHAEKLFLCRKEDLLGRTPWQLSPELQPDGSRSTDKARELIHSASTGKRQHFEWQHQDCNGKPFDTEISLSPFSVNGENLLLAIIRDISERKQHEATRQVLYQIARATIATESTEELLASIRESLSALMDTTNFYVALYDRPSGMFSIPFEKTEGEQVRQFPARGSLTGLVIASRKSSLLYQQDMEELISRGTVKLIGSMSKVWLGVPLFEGGEVIGAVVIQDYHNPDALDTTHLQLLEYASSQISLAIQRAKNIEELKAAKEKAEESDKLKTAFLNNLSHEIRTPLNAIMGFSEVLSEGSQHPDRVRELTKIICQSGTQLLSVIDDIISISTIETGLIEPHEESTDIRQVMESVYNQLQPTVRHKPVKFRLNNMLIANDICTITDQTKLTQILTNLVHNAVKYTEEGHVEFGCRPQKDKLLFYVADTGIGIHPDDQPAIWERFQQVEPMPSGEKSGVGLGLAISKSFVRLLKGEMWVESEPGKGSIFYFTIPRKPCDPDQSEDTKGKKVELLPEKYRILVAEDERYNFELTNTILSTYDVEVLHAWNGEEAVQMAEEKGALDLVLMDIKMPVMNGLQATRQIKEMFPALPVIAMTAYAQPDDREKAMSAGCDDYISKPVSIDQFMQIIRKNLGGRQEA